eukprot:CAMPEP_0172177884 /NCGR_PEP_ID=MMETSP1050-20130122/15709_1 /TAXON_ID=233186 /ORGANISM="Cryptomonas curvata, Strain CCAP979/52" /LENGTH=614 /DNA_ID=CAMNT_0012850503 /DNA_START=242 /DNA_END=2086 /DNA_ORIENTATION=+
MTAALTNYFLAYSYRDPNSFDLKSFTDIQTTKDFWNWLEIYFVDTIYKDSYYNGDLMNPLDRNTLLQYMKQTGGFRVLQRRALPNSCEVLEKYSLFLSDCYAQLQFDGLVGAIDKSPFVGSASGTVYNYTAPSVWLDPGYVFQFAADRATALQQIRSLKSDRWISKATQYVRLDFAVYNGNVGQFARVAFQLLISPTGKILPTLKISCRRYSFYQTTTDFVRLALELLVVAGWLCYVYAFFRDVLLLRRQAGSQILAPFFFDTWNAVDIVHLLCLAMVIATWIFIVLDPTMNNLAISEEAVRMPDGGVVDFSTTALAVDFYFAVNGLNMLVSILRVLKFLRMNAFMGQLTDAFQLMLPSVTQFVVLLFIFLLLFTAIGTVLFGADLVDFCSTLDSIDLVMGFGVGWADPFQLFEADPNAAIFFYYPFTFLNGCFILPLTVAIIMEAYGYIKEAYDKAKSGDLADVISLPFYAQLYRGLVRNVGGLCGLGAERREIPNKFDVGRIFSDYAGRDLVPTSEVQRHFEQDEETPWELAESIIEKYGAFQADPALQTLLDRQDHAQQRGVGPVAARVQSFMEDVGGMSLRVEQLLVDQEVMHRKMDLLTAVFQPALMTD